VTDEALIIRFLNGDNEAFNMLTTRWQKPIYNFVLRYAADSDSAKDLTQNTFISAYRGLRKLDNPARFSSWLYRIALNAARDAGRKSQRHPTVSMSDEAVSNTLQMPSYGNPDQSAHRSSMRMILNRALQELPEEQRVVVIMKEYQGLKFREIAEAMEIPINTVKSRLYYGLKSLRKLFDEWNVTKEVVWYDA
jgi:RNA polymerase sigma-70 factor (ECF subfamily)